MRCFTRRLLCSRCGAPRQCVAGWGWLVWEVMYAYAAASMLPWGRSRSRNRMVLLLFFSSSTVFVFVCFCFLHALFFFFFFLHALVGSRCLINRPAVCSLWTRSESCGTSVGRMHPADVPDATTGRLQLQREGDRAVRCARPTAGIQLYLHTTVVSVDSLEL